jgi:hypothetical protein
MRLVFCCDPISPKTVDEAYRAEAIAAAEAGLEQVLIDYEALANEGQPDRAVRRVPAQEEAMTGMYRGWMLKPQQYRLLYDALAIKGIHLLNAPDAYRNCHWLPEYYHVIEAITPKSVWMPFGGKIDIEQVMRLLEPFGFAPVIVKDYVKSRKHEWEQACFIPSASDREAVERVVGKFVEYQDEDLSEGLVFREFIEFEPLAQHSKSGMPLTVEFRIFWLDGRPMYCTEYWEEGDYRGLQPPIEQFQPCAENVQSRFFTMDVAKRRNGNWMIVELGDRQVAGLPEHADVGEFYSALKNMLAPQNGGGDGAK